MFIAVLNPFARQLKSTAINIFIYVTA